MHYTYSKGLLVRGFSWFVAKPFIFKVFLWKNDVGYIPQTSSPPSYAGFLFDYYHYIGLITTRGWKVIKGGYLFMTSHEAYM